MDRNSSKALRRSRRRIGIRKRIVGTAAKPRLAIYKSLNHMYAQIIDDATGKTVLTVSSLKIKDKSGKAQAEAVGQEVAKAATAKNIKSVVFDRNGFVYHGRVKALADGARAGGLTF